MTDMRSEGTCVQALPRVDSIILIIHSSYLTCGAHDNTHETAHDNTYDNTHDNIMITYTQMLVRIHANVGQNHNELRTRLCIRMTTTNP